MLALSIILLKISPLTHYIRGPERIRTAVGAFAELSLATRPQDHLMFLFSDFVPIFIGIRFVQKDSKGVLWTFGETASGQR